MDDLIYIAVLAIAWAGLAGALVGLGAVLCR